MKLSYFQIKEFIEKYGDGHIYYSHKYVDGKIEVKYFPYFTKFADEDNLEEFKKEVDASSILQDKYLETIVLTPAYAYLADKKDKSGKEPLVLNYKKFLDAVKGRER